MAICFEIFANILELDDAGQPVNGKHAEQRAATWLYKYCTEHLPPGQPWAVGGTRTGALTSLAAARARRLRVTGVRWLHPGGVGLVLRYSPVVPSKRSRSKSA